MVTAALVSRAVKEEMDAIFGPFIKEENAS